MPQEVDACKFGTLDYNERTHNVWALCRLGRHANGKCLTKGRPECSDYQRGIFYTPEEIRQKLGIEEG